MKWIIASEILLDWVWFKFVTNAWLISWPLVRSQAKQKLINHEKSCTFLSATYRQRNVKHITRRIFQSLHIVIVRQTTFHRKSFQLWLFYWVVSFAQQFCCSLSDEFIGFAFSYIMLIIPATSWWWEINKQTYMRSWTDNNKEVMS